MAYRLVLPFADVGDGITPADGAKLHVYEPGTVNPKTSYSDFALTTSNSNPVIADSDGVFGDIFLDTQADISLTDKNDVPIWGPKRVYPPSDSISTSETAQALSPQTAEEIAAGITPTDYTYEPLNIKRYGGVGDAATDNTQAFADALAVAAQFTFTAPVYVPAGRYLADQIAPLKTSNKPARIVGDGFLHSAIEQNTGVTTGTPLIYQQETDGSGGQEGIILENLLLQGSADGGHVIHLENCKFPKIEDCYLVGASGVATLGYALVRFNKKVIYSRIRNVRIKGVDHDYGFWLGDSTDVTPLTTNIWIENILQMNTTNTFVNGQWLRLDATGAVHVQNVKIDGMNGTASSTLVDDGFDIHFALVGTEYQAGATGSTHDFRFVDCTGVTLEQCTVGDADNTNGLTLENVQQFVFKNGYFVNGDLSIDASCQEIYIQNSGFNQFNLSGAGAVFPKLQITNCRIIDSDLLLTETYSTNTANTMSLPHTGTAQTLSGPGAIDITSAITHVTTTGADALTLADGEENQRKFIVMAGFGGNGTLTPTNLGNGSTITFDTAGDSADLLFTNGSWYFMGGTATLA